MKQSELPSKSVKNQVRSDFCFFVSSVDRHWCHVIDCTISCQPDGQICPMVCQKIQNIEKQNIKHPTIQVQPGNQTFHHGVSTWSAHCPTKCPNARWNRCQEDLNSSLLENWRRPPGNPHTTWMKTIQQDMKSYNLSLNEAIDMAQNSPLWRLMSTFSTSVLARK